MDCGYVHNFVNTLCSCKELAICTVRIGKVISTTSKSTSSSSSVFFAISFGEPKNHAGDDGTPPTYVIGGLAFGVNFNEQSNRTPRCSWEASAAGLPWL